MHSKRAFTLIELLVVIAIIGLLLPFFNDSKNEVSFLNGHVD